MPINHKVRFMMEKPIETGYRLPTLSTVKLQQMMMTSWTTLTCQMRRQRGAYETMTVARKGSVRPARLKKSAHSVSSPPLVSTHRSSRLLIIA